MKSYTLHRKPHTSSYSNLVNVTNNTSPMNTIYKKSSALHLNSREIANQQKVSTIIP
jgi:hypothetical protein